MNGAPFVWTDARVREALGLPEDGESEGTYGAVSTDTRSLENGNLFVALRGERFDGHDFLAQAVRAGCGAVVVDRDVASVGVPMYRVADTLEALGDLARLRRDQWDVPVVGITGSSGKTTVKDLTLGALAGSISAYGTSGNFNNRVGLPLTILGLPGDAGAVVLEMGTNQPGEIGALAGVARPTVGVVTTVSETHVEGLVDLNGVLHEKLDLVRAVAPEGTVIVGDDPPVLPESARSLRPDVRIAGWGPEADDRLRPIEAELRDDGTYAFEWQGHRIDLKVPGQHGVYNALLALAVAEALGVPAGAAAAGVSGVGPGRMRGEVRKVGSLTLLVDCYNANPQSVAAAVQLLNEMSSTGRRVAVLGSMLELGEHAERFHRTSLEDALGTDLDRVYATGAFADAAAGVEDGRLVPVSDAGALREQLVQEIEPHDTVLLKASRGEKLEALIPALEQAFGGEG